MALVRATTACYILVLLTVSCAGEYCYPSCAGRPQPLPVVNTAECGKQPTCNPHYKYRSVDGSCSNLQHPSWAQAGTPFIRVLPAHYQNGKDEPRRSANDRPLPNVRQMSSHLFPDRFVPDHIHTFNLMQFGQVMAHDLTHILFRQSDASLVYGSDAKTAQNLRSFVGGKLKVQKSGNGNIFLPNAENPTIPCNNPPNETVCYTAGDQAQEPCCTPTNEVPDSVPDICMPMEVYPNDYFYSQFNVRCLPFNRAGITDNGTCYKYPVEQINSASHVPDASLVYGSDAKTAQNLRSFVGGKLKVQKSGNGNIFLPNAENPTIPCNNPPNETVCYTAGDDRVNQNTGITVYTIALLRLHNYLCDKLSKLNPHWNDETLYQEARRIVVAFLQHTTFKHFLPIILGKDYMYKKGLSVENCCDCCINYHNPDINPSTFNEYAAGAYRSFHTLVPRQVIFVNKKFESNGYINMDDFFFRPTYIQFPGVFDSCLRGMANQPQQSEDQFFTVGLTNLLFKFDKPWGNDLESTDMQRGRDCGLPPYNELRHLCGLKRAKTFEDFADVMTKKSILKLKRFYSCVDDVDLFVGGMMEELIPGTLVGPTFQCIIGEQFYHYMRGDRFYYENCGLPWSFEKDQMKEIYRMSLAWLFCVVGDDLHAMQYDTFKRPSAHNQIVHCNDIPSPDFEAWKEH